MTRDRSWRPLLALSALAAGVVLTRSELGDYNLGVSENNAAPTIHFLAGGDLGPAADVIPAMGLVSVLLRVPAAVIGGSDLLLAHRLGSLLCLIAVVALAFVLDRRATAQDRPLSYRLVLGVLVVAGPGVLWAIDAGHPEEFLGGALCVGAVLAAIERRTVLSAVLLGLAIGTKQWALLAVVPTLLAIGEPRWLDAERIKAGVLAATVAAIFVVPPIIASPARYEAVSTSLTETDRVYPQSIWWPVSPEDRRTLELGGGESTSLTTWSLPLGLTRGPATMIAVLLSLALVPIAFARGGLRDPLAALTALLTLRAVLDPMNLSYYFAPALLALAAWEVWRGRPAQFPVVLVAASLASLVAWSLGADPPPFAAWAIWMAATLPLLFVSRLGHNDPAPKTNALTSGA